MTCCAVWDITISKDKYSKDEVEAIFKENCKKWAFQLEQGKETGFVHFQARISLKKKTRVKGVWKLLPKIHDKAISPTSKTNMGNNFYVLKDDTRIEGPWFDEETKYSDGNYIPRQIREIKELRPFQKTIIKLSKVWDTRTINWIHCPEGNRGKSILKGYMLCNKLGRVIPMVNDYDKLMGAICSMPTSNCYLLDLPRAIKKDKLWGLLSGIESIKDGYACDLRYKFREKYFDCPNIFVFSNTMPDMKSMTGDRWKIWEIDNKMELVKKVYNAADWGDLDDEDKEE